MHTQPVHLALLHSRLSTHHKVLWHRLSGGTVAGNRLMRTRGCTVFQFDCRVY